LAGEDPSFNLEYIFLTVRYNPESHNCFSFVLEFLRCLEVDAWSSYLLNKTSLCSAFILPATTLAGKYISLYRQLLEKAYVISKSAA
jgi:hypothetical protein